MDSKYEQQCEAVITATEEGPVTVVAENVSLAAPPTMQAPVMAPAAPVNVNQHSLVRTDRGIVLSQRGRSFHSMCSESSLVPFEYKHGDPNCQALRYHGDGFDMILSVHGGEGGAFKRPKFIVRHDGTEGQAPVTRLFMLDFSERANKWMSDFIGQIMERKPSDTSRQIYHTISTFCFAVSSNSLPPPPLVNYCPTVQSTSITSFTMNENSVDEYPPWNDLLPLDCFRLIHDRLDALATLSFPLVCKLWKELWAEKRRLRPGAPTLLTSPSLGGGWDDPEEGYRGIFFIQNIILSRETFFIEVDNFRYSRWIGGKDEWLVTVNDRDNTFNLLNPATGACIPLVPEDVRARYDITRIQLCQTPDEANGYFAIGIAYNHLAYTMAGSDQWFLLENPCERYHLMMYTDAILHRGKIVAICNNGDLWSWDLHGQGEDPKPLFRSTICSERGEVHDFVLAPSLNNDNLLIVSPYGENLPLGIAGNSTFHNQWNFRVHGVVLREVDIDAESIEDVHGIGDRALFLGPNYPFYVPVKMPSGDFKKNHVYITDISDYDVVAINLCGHNLPDKVTFMDYNGPMNPYQVPMWFRPAFPRNLG